MKRSIATAACFLWASVCFAQAKPATNVELRDSLVEMGKRDQKIRKGVATVLSAAGPNSEDFRVLAKEMALIDADNLAQLEKIIEQTGWPGSDVVGTDASESAFLIVQHASLQVRKKYLPMFRQAVRDGKARGANLALLEDRINTGEGRKQIYGSQVTAGPDGIPRIDPIEDPQHVDTRRAAIGLPPMNEYIARLEKEIGRKIDRSELTLK